MLQSYSAVAPCICIPRHSPLFNHALTLYCATGAYLRHAVGGGIPQPLHNCVSAGLRSGTPPRGFPSGAAPALRRGGDDDRRRAFPPPRRWWQAVIAPQTICYIIYNQDNTHQTTAGAQPRTASGVRFRWGDLVRPACRHDPAWRNTGLRTAPTTYRGWKLHRLLSSYATSGVSTMASRPKPVFAAPGAAQRPPSAVGGDCRNVDNLFISRHLRSCAGFRDI